MASFKSIFKRAEVSRIGLQGENSIIRPKHKTVFYMNPGSKQLFENENETDKILEISLIKRPTGAKFCVKIVSGEENFFLYSEFMKQELENRLFIVDLETPEVLATTVFFCQTSLSLRENCLVNVAADMIKLNYNILRRDIIPLSIIKELRRLEMMVLNGSFPKSTDYTFLTHNTNIVDVWFYHKIGIEAFMTFFRLEWPSDISHGKPLLFSPAEHVGPPVLVWHYVAFAAGLGRRPRPEEGVLPVSVIYEVVEHQGLVIHGVDISTDLHNTW